MTLLLAGSQQAASQYRYKSWSDASASSPDLQIFHPSTIATPWLHCFTIGQNALQLVPTMFWCLSKDKGNEYMGTTNLWVPLQLAHYPGHKELLMLVLQI